MYLIQDEIEEWDYDFRLIDILCFGNLERVSLYSVALLFKRPCVVTLSNRARIFNEAMLLLDKSTSKNKSSFFWDTELVD